MRSLSGVWDAQLCEISHSLDARWYRREPLIVCDNLGSPKAVVHAADRAGRSYAARMIMNRK